MNKDDLLRIFRYYLPFGNLSGQELRLPPRLALHMAEELGREGFTILGLDGWYYLPQVHGLAQDLAVDFFVGQAILEGPDAGPASAKSIQAFIQNHLPSHIDFVSFTLDYPPQWGAELLMALNVSPLEV